MGCSLGSMLVATAQLGAVNVMVMPASLWLGRDKVQEGVRESITQHAVLIACWGAHLVVRLCGVVSVWVYKGHIGHPHRCRRRQALHEGWRVGNGLRALHSIVIGCRGESGGRGGVNTAAATVDTHT